MAYQPALYNATDEKVMQMPFEEIKKQVDDARIVDGYFIGATTKKDDGEWDISSVGEKRASDIEGFDEKETQLSDGSPVEDIFKGRSPAEKIQLRKVAEKVINAGVLGMSNKDEIKQAKASAAIKHRGLEEAFFQLQKVKEGITPSIFLGATDPTAEQAPKTLWDHIAAHPDFQAMIKQGQWPDTNITQLNFGDLDPRGTLFRSASMIHDRTSWPPEVTRIGLVVPEVVRRIQVTDLFSMIPTGQEAVRYERETIDTDNVKGFSQGQALQESGVSVAEHTVPIVNFGHYMALNEIAIQDEMRLQWLVNWRLPEMVMRALDLALLQGTGLNNTITGLSSVTGIQTRAKPNGNDETIIDALLKGKTRARIMGGKDIGMPSAYILHVEDIERICLTKTTEGMYIYGNPVGNQPMTVWGLPVAEYNGGAAGTGWIGDFMMYAAIYMRRGLSVQFGMINDDFIKLQHALRAYMRCNLVVTRPAAFMKMTNLDG